MLIAGKTIGFMVGDLMYNVQTVDDGLARLQTNDVTVDPAWFPLVRNAEGGALTRDH
jgi:hypothetical protein